MSLWKNYFGLGEVASSGTTPPMADKPLPANWYTSSEMWELERRAVFSRQWILISHSLRFSKTGDYLVYRIAGYPIILVRDRQGNFNAFHNICRHRAFPVVTEDKGTARIFACKYHGWSYGLNGNLAKAPGYQEVEGFDKSKNGLFPVHVHVDNHGFIWVNLDAQEQPEVQWEDDNNRIQLQKRFTGIKWDEYDFDHTWEMEGEYNWKLLAVLRTSHLDTEGGTIPDTSEAIARDLKDATTYYFPNTSLTVTPHYFFMQRFVPSSATKGTMRYEFYRNRNSGAEVELINQTYQHIMTEERDLCTQIQETLKSGEIHARLETGPFDLQNTVREIVTKHHNKEQEAGKPIWPARQVLPSTATTSSEDVDFCNKLEAKAKATSGGCGAPECCSASGGGMSCGTNEALVF
ncbi:Rieske [2Fe-2S] iron-sulfur domain-containing protein [Aspergillus avenaceus]|uniref:Choline monooxygenase, chloroplastic n=1 Tax=Aspergillus avenaceus TaxID=36643 RepID=A0A5N6TQU7_ASPAV|nr:Rieske [2Fe-2S] iron-sulfur domain-containing protein [Aspergillus avenaceus]